MPLKVPSYRSIPSAVVGADLAARGVQEDVPSEYESVYGRAATAMPIGIKAPLYHEQISSGRQPEAIRDCVTYEDPCASCYEGLPRLSADARRFAEGAHTGTSERADAIRQYLDEHHYPGLDHIGGVGFVEK